MKCHVWCKQPKSSYVELIHRKPYSNRGRENRYMKLLNADLAELLSRGDIKRRRR